MRTRWRLTSATLALLLTLSALFIAAGGLGLATSMALIGFIFAPVVFVSGWRAFKSAPTLVFLGVLCVGWLCLSHAWSPYEKADQAYKMALLIPLFVMGAYAGFRLTREEAERQGQVLTIVCLLVGGYFLIEALSGGMIGGWIELNLEESTYPAEAIRNAKVTLSRGATAFLMLAGPVALMLWRRGETLDRAGAMILIVMAGFAAASFDVEANILAFGCGLAIAGATLFKPRLAPQMLLGGAGVWVLGAPLFMGIGLALLPDGLEDRLPLSWAWRLEIWRAVLDQIRQAPLIGHGLDSMRALSDPVPYRDIIIDRLPLHAHNAGLQIWMDAGATGAILCSATLFAAAGALGRARLSTDQLISLSYVGGIWLVSIMLGYGVYQEWHHAALALGVFTAFLNRTDPAS
ncbi:O-antigen ligase family protein [Oceanicaulis sp. LC35]|uniref:O-antigen ligase family protein n=1 Tax=Oceanicaulis sp. LC35 TaxID=3349635 RepID=UPI003F86B2ED